MKCVVKIMIKVTIDYNKGFSLIPEEVRPVDEFFTDTIDKAQMLIESLDMPIYKITIEQ